MKLPYVLFSTMLLLAACTQQRGTAAAPDAQGKAMGNEIDPPAADNRGSATGTIQSIDAAAGKLTIAHGPVAALKWPAMTMAFKATPAQLASVRKGQHVMFEFVADGSGATITGISPD
jgi:Cu(I)/Ag(I) efflux system periplasmic protein CusF